MNREMLFRGKRTDNGEWVQGSYVQDKEWARHGIYQLELRGAFYQLVRHEVAPNTIGQFTGLLDKNGNRVFEGDIVKGGIYSAYEIKWDAERAEFNTGAAGISISEVIGNIHEEREVENG